MTFNSWSLDTFEYKGVSSAISQAYDPDAEKSIFSSVIEVGVNCINCDKWMVKRIVRIKYICTCKTYVYVCAYL